MIMLVLVKHSTTVLLKMDIWEFFVMNAFTLRVMTLCSLLEKDKMSVLDVLLSMKMSGFICFYSWLIKLTYFS